MKIENIIENSTRHDIHLISLAKIISFPFFLIIYFSRIFFSLCPKNYSITKLLKTFNSPLKIN